ncbi:AraC family transcriptional regulator [Dysgonomonas sp. 521]|uniref:helix-turn-helix domain-containing protein n=1 Tax=Dysgonomonas sp. 521 TaxID=2302932 RepID=UPI0013CFB000|nr:helix-turn-helix domain-containing protein [Dysgonomonas sp. 521]NDV94514.1 AraC family transcriptional regulator [Dysgonomonas sp. 521]
MSTIINMDTIHDFNSGLGVETLHPLISVVNFEEVKPATTVLRRFGFYYIVFKGDSCDVLKYGRNQYDYQEGTLVFIAPGQVAGNENGTEFIQLNGWGLCFHPDLLRGTTLGQKMKDYTFFAYESNESLHMSERERQIILDCFLEIREELTQKIDKHTKSILISNLEVLLNHCLRFYDRQFITRGEANKDILSRFEQLLDNYFDSEKPQINGLPSVQYFADQLHLSANYFGDLIKKETGKSAQEYIQLKTIDKAKDKLYNPEKSVNEVAYELGFKYPHHFSRMFKKVVGSSPTDYRMMT